MALTREHRFLSITSRTLQLRIFHLKDEMCSFSRAIDWYVNKVSNSKTKGPKVEKTFSTNQVITLMESEIRQSSSQLPNEARNHVLLLIRMNGNNTSMKTTSIVLAISPHLPLSRYQTLINEYVIQSNMVGESSTCPIESLLAPTRSGEAFRPKLAELTKSASRWRWLPRAVFPNLRVNASSDRRALKSSFVEHSKSCRLVSTSIGFGWNKTPKIKFKVEETCFFLCLLLFSFSYEFHDSAVQMSVFWVRADRSSDLKVKMRPKRMQIKGVNRSVVAGDILRESRTTLHCEEEKTREIVRHRWKKPTKCVHSIKTCEIKTAR